METMAPVSHWTGKPTHKTGASTSEFIYLSWSLMMQSESITQYDTWNWREMVLNKNNSKVHYTPVTTNHFLILNIVGDTQEATCPMPILLLFYLGNRLVFFSTFTVQREKESRKRGRGDEEKAEGGMERGIEWGRKRMDCISQPALQLSQFCSNRGNSLAGWNLQAKKFKSDSLMSMNAACHSWSCPCFKCV